jgi:hypothetical protein
MQVPVVLSGTSRALKWQEKWQEKDKHLVLWEDDDEAMPEMAVWLFWGCHCWSA